MESSRLSCGKTSSVVTPLLLFEHSSADSIFMLPFTFPGVLLPASSDSELLMMFLPPVLLLLLLLLVVVVVVGAAAVGELRGR